MRIQEREVAAMAVGLGVGAGVMYLFDPDRGTRRRHMLCDQAQSKLHHAEKAVERTAEDLAHRAVGVVAETKAHLQPEKPIPAQKLLGRVRTELGRLVGRPKGIQVLVADGGVVTLRGSVAPGDIPHLVEGVGKVLGVHRVVNELNTPGAAHGDHRFLRWVGAGVGTCLSVMLARRH